MSDPERLPGLREFLDALYGKNVAGPKDLIDVRVETLDWLVGEVERLQRYEAMWEDCRSHRDQAEQRARRYMGIVQQVAELVAPDEDDLP